MKFGDKTLEGIWKLDKLQGEVTVKKAGDLNVYLCYFKDDACEKATALVQPKHSYKNNSWLNTSLFATSVACGLGAYYWKDANQSAPLS